MAELDCVSSHAKLKNEAVSNELHSKSFLSNFWSAIQLLYSLIFYCSVWKLVKDPRSCSGIPCSLAAAFIALIRNAMFLPRFLIVCKPSRSSSTSEEVKPCTSFQYVEDTIGIELIVKYLLISSKADVEPALREETTAAPVFIAFVNTPEVL